MLKDSHLLCLWAPFPEDLSNIQVFLLFYQGLMFSDVIQFYLDLIFNDVDSCIFSALIL